MAVGASGRPPAPEPTADRLAFYEHGGGLRTRVECLGFKTLLKIPGRLWLRSLAQDVLDFGGFHNSCLAGTNL